MKIDDSIKKAAGLPVGPTQTRGGKGADKAGSVGKTAEGASESVHVSSQLQALAGTEGVFDSSKVAEIKAAIAEGKFQVDPEKVANGLLDTVKDLIHTRKA
ncbi:MAG: flagellar biosynthesis anti-sigma factor FlgM [Burkholderiales bacterium]|nr:flagellar biosynthesis anti-sigma factor FlgM [Burkholderiales bacterium]